MALKGISDRVTSNKSKYLLVENELKKLKALHLSYFWGNNYFEGNDRAQNALVFQAMQKHFDLTIINQIKSWKSKGLSNHFLNLAGAVVDIILS